MKLNKSYIVRKDLTDRKGLGLKNTHITALVSQAQIFKNVEKQKGYAIPFNFNQALLIHVGCMLYKLGLSFRHIDQALTQLSDYNFLDLGKPQELVIMITMASVSLSDYLDECGENFDPKELLKEFPEGESYAKTHQGYETLIAMVTGKIDLMQGGIGSVPAYIL